MASSFGTKSRVLSDHDLRKDKISNMSKVKRLFGDGGFEATIPSGFRLMSRDEQARAGIDATCLLRTKKITGVLGNIIIFDIGAVSITIDRLFDELEKDDADTNQLLCETALAGMNLGSQSHSVSSVRFLDLPAGRICHMELQRRTSTQRKTLASLLQAGEVYILVFGQFANRDKCGLEGFDKLVSSWQQHWLQ